MNLDELSPHSGDHSIQNAVLAIEWTAPVGLEQLEKMRASAREVLKRFPKEDVQQTLRVDLSAAQGGVVTPTPEVGGYSYSLFSGAGELQKQVQLTRTNCLLMISDYKRWTDVIAEAQEIFSAVLPALPTSVTVGTVGLQYSDRFVWKGDPENLKMRAVFCETSPYIALHALECHGLWHSHHGYFEDSDTPVQHRRLNIVNVNVIDEPAGRAIQILTSHRAQIGEAVSNLAAAQWTKLVLDIHNHLHKVNKTIFGELLSKPMLAKIHLTDEG